MKINTEHNIFRIIAITLVFAIITPAIVKFSHGLQNHEHEVCFGESTSHLHEMDIDCDFYKFKLNTSYYFDTPAFETVSNVEVKTINVSYYFFLRTHQQNSSYLRGPPSLG